MHFNSTMVQFWEDGYFFIYQTIKFQFHYGAILGWDALDLKIGDEISIPLWCNFGFCEFLIKSYAFNISIPLWCNFGKHPCFLSHNVLQQISIPLWCNFGVWDVSSMKTFDGFQFHYGAILGHLTYMPCNSSSISIPLWCNFGVADPSEKQYLQNLISIPLWCNFG